VYTSQCTLVKRRIGDSATRLLELMLMRTKNLSQPRQTRRRKRSSIDGNFAASAAGPPGFAFSVDPGQDRPTDRQYSGLAQLSGPNVQFIRGVFYELIQVRFNAQGVGSTVALILQAPTQFGTYSSLLTQPHVKQFALRSEF
jgi:hypothetical protein